jgi:hypothetical protein
MYKDKSRFRSLQTFLPIGLGDTTITEKSGQLSIYSMANSPNADLKIVFGV